MANVYCIPQAGRLPGAGGGGPQWWDAAATAGLGLGDYSPRIDDPRWAGSLKRGEGSGSLTEAFAFRALRGQIGADTFLYLSFNWEENPNGTIDGSSVQVGLHTGTGAPTAANPAFVLNITLNNAAAVAAAPGVDAGGANYFSTGVWRDTGAGWTDITATAAAWAWINQYTRVWAKSGTTNRPWAVHLLIPIRAIPDGLPLGPKFGLCYYVRTTIGVAAAFYRWSPVSFPPMPVGGVIQPAAANFYPCTLGAPAAGDTCQTGLSLSSADIGSIDGRDDNGALNPQMINRAVGTSTTFFARPFNEDPVATFPADSIRATFKLANWGSLPVSDRWKAICSTPVAPPGFQPAIGPMSSQELRATWPGPADAAESAYYLTNWHQCMLVELSSVKAAVFFSQSSTVRNMDFRKTSLATADAEISVVGLKPFSTQPRDVYIVVDTKNMPGKLDEATRDRYRKAEKLLPSFYPQVLDTEDRTVKASAPPTDGGGDGQQSAYDEFEQVVPTYRCFVYHDTGQRIEWNGRIIPILEPQPSFGYHVWHEGAFEGWDFRLRGAQKIAENVYLIRVPNNGSVKITNVIHAVEAGDQREPEEMVYPLPEYTLRGKDGCLTLLESLGPVGRAIATVVRSIAEGG